MKKECKHEDMKLVGAFVPPQTCIKCNQPLMASEIEIFGDYHEIGGFCENEKCERYLILIA